MDDIATRAALSALSSGISNRYWVEEVDAIYKYDSSSSATVDGWTVLASAAAGRFVLKSKRLTLPILGGSSDDWANFAAASAALAPAGVKLELGPGTYLAKSRQLVASYSHIVGNKKTVIHATIATVGDPRDSVFSAFSQVTGTDALALDTNIGDMTFKIVGSMTFAVGDFVILNSKQFRNAMYQIRAWNGGTKVARIDRPLKMPYGGPLALTSFPAGSLVQKVTPAIGIKIEGNGATIYGACDRFIELWAGWECEVRGFKCGDGTSTTASERVISFDTPSYNCHAFDITGDGGYTTVLGLSFEAAEACTYNRCDIKRTLEAGVIFQDAVECAVRDCNSVDGGSIGALFTAATAGSEPDSGSVWGSHGCLIDGGSYSGNGNCGINFQRGSTNNRVDGAASVTGNATSGIVENDASGNSIGGGVVIKSNFNGLFVDATSARLRVDRSVTIMGSTTAVGVGSGASQLSVSAKILSSTHSVNTFGAVNLEGAVIVTEAGNTAPAIEIGGAGSVTGRFDLFYGDVGTTGAINVLGALEFSGTLVSQNGGIGIRAYGGATVNVGPTAIIVGHGNTGGQAINLLDTAVANISAGAAVEASAVSCANSDNTTVNLIQVAFSKHFAA
jgi:hypothetical protein